MKIGVTGGSGLLPYSRAGRWKLEICDPATLNPPKINHNA
jgi:hypothetical protein